MPARLFCQTGELAGAAFLIDREATIGRLEENQITLHPSYISGHHARIFFDDAEGRYFLEDFRSSNGTRLDGTRVTEPVRLNRLHVITFARQVDFIFQVLTEAAVPGFGKAARTTPNADEAREKTHVGDFFTPLPALPGLDANDPGARTQLHDPFADLQAPAPAQETGEKTTFRDAFSPMPPLPPDVLKPLPAETSLPDDSESTPGGDESGPSAAPAHFVLAATLPDETVQTFSVSEGTQVIGRETDCDITLPDSSISRRHTRITLAAGRVTLEDLGSKNGTFVDGKKLTTPVEIHPESRIRFGLSIEATLRRA